MKIKIITIGKKISSELAGVVDTYDQRLRPYATIEWCFIPSVHKHTDSEQKLAESRDILQKINSKDYVILLDEKGAELDNLALAKKLNQVQISGISEIAVVIGGAYGVSQAVKKRADFTWRLSALVFPHQLVRLILIEQLYRSYTILANHPYHHA